jgi:hypothetical protein
MSLKRTSVSTPKLNALKAEMQKMEWSRNWRASSSLTVEVLDLLKREVLAIKNELRAEVFHDVLTYIQLNWRGIDTYMQRDGVIQLITYIRNFDYSYVKPAQPFGLGYWKIAYPSKDFVVDFAVPEQIRKENHPTISMVINTFQAIREKRNSLLAVHSLSGLPIMQDYLPKQ